MEEGMAITGHAWLSIGMRVVLCAVCLDLFLIDNTAGVVAWTTTAVAAELVSVLPSGALGKTACMPDGDGDAI